jgi:hypothetical protein
MINPYAPKNWRDLQNQVAQILLECGFNVEVTKVITTARGEVEIDVFAEDPTQTPPNIYLCECKHWDSNVPKREIHAFRTVLSDFGANWGLVISKKGFQPGAFQAAEHTNLKLLNWQEFQKLFAARWYREYMLDKLGAESEALIEYTEPINTRIFRKADNLPLRKQKLFGVLRVKYGSLAWLSIFLSMPYPPHTDSPPRLPLIGNLESSPVGLEAVKRVPKEILKTTSLRHLMELMKKHLRLAIAEFDHVFGERA